MYKLLQDKTIIVMGGGSSGWLSAMHYLNTSMKENLNLKVILVCSSVIPIIGVGEGTTMIFRNFLEMCNLDKNEFLTKTKGSFKYGIEFKNWNFDDQSYYHLFNPLSHEVVKFYQYCINHNITTDYSFLQKKLHGRYYDICVNNKIDLELYPHVAYHFSAPLIIKYFEEKCKQFLNFRHIDSTINKINYYENGYIESLDLNSGEELKGDLFINCLGLKGREMLHDEYYDVVDISDIIPNNRACAMQVKNKPDQKIENCTVYKAEEYGWSWKVPQYDRTGYGYVHSTHYYDDEQKTYEELIRSHNIDEKDILFTNTIPFKTFYNKKHFHKNCLTVGLASGFIEPLEATSLHLTLSSLFSFNQFLFKRTSIDKDAIETYNKKRTNVWINSIKNIIFHFMNESNRNDYWRYFNNLSDIPPFDNFYEMYYPNNKQDLFSQENYFAISLGLRKKNYMIYNFYEENVELPERIKYFLSIKEVCDFSQMPTHKQVLDELNRVTL